MRRISEWQERGWVRGEKAGDGNQGHTFFARRAEGPVEEYDFVLKKLKRQEDPVRRKRFHIEAESLRALNSVAGVAKFVDSNADQFADVESELYVVTERIKGPDLEKFLPLPIDVALACDIVGRVLKTIDECHQVPVLHRDIKPCHIVLRNGNFDDPVLIDFGLAFNQEFENGSPLTLSDQGVGNRFVILPEQFGASTKRDPRSDITQCLAVLFYLLTGRVPGQILSSDGRKPHEQLDLANVIRNVSPGQLQKIKRHFDNGFDFNPDCRWQTASDLTSELDLIASSTMSDSDSAFRINLRSLLDRAKQNPEIDLQRRMEAFCNDFDLLCDSKIKEVQRDCHELVTIERGAAQQDQSRLQIRWLVNTKAIKTSPAQILVQVIRDRDVLTLDSKLLSDGFVRKAGPRDTRTLAQRTNVNLVDPSTSRITESFVEEVLLAVLNICLVPEVK